ncbi:uridine kinase [Evansella caseinilytica]|uniref:Uridine kinase n=1 Tax=Evansella caseinilytica TaxID=1503961 RepID=A0A1H3R3M5_9BACI|nr:kinase [Evansella caseinilytica]SDZ20277.1 uridine kinase [Evansella caseinilytica]
MSIQEIADRLLAQRSNDASTDCHFIVGIDGLGGAGKTTFVNKLQQTVKTRNCEAVILHLDDYIVETRKRYDTGHDEWYEYYYFQWDIQLLEAELFQKLHDNSSDLTLPLYERSTDTVIAEELELPPATVVLIEGVFLQRKEWREYFDFVIFIDCTPEARAERVLNRDLYIGDYQTRLKKYKQRYWQAEDYYMNSENPKSGADYIYSSV